ncbi:MAG: hypothetical protein EP338_08905 [Bacteroidetes bacterium]|nr:MAG: hypothetical protein EP338_08905 [Bacteroidota bacterium]
MNQKIHTIFRTLVTHTYFNNDVCRALKFEAFPHSKLAMKRLALLVRQFENQYEILSADPAGQEVNWSARLASAPDLCFYLRTDDPRFVNYSNLPMEVGAGQIYYFSNRKNSTTLQKGKSVGVKDLVKQSTMTPTIAIPEQQKDNTLSLKDLTGNLCWQKEISSGPARQFTAVLEEPGYYQVFLGSKKLDHFVALQGDLPIQCMGVFQLNIVELISTLAASKPTTFSLDYLSRSTYWQYDLVLDDQKQIEINEMSISGAGGVSYTGPQAGSLPNGQKTSQYVSGKPIALQENGGQVQTLTMSYKNAFSGRSQNREVRMPYPDAQLIRVVRDDQGIESFYSNQIVYV